MKSLLIYLTLSVLVLAAAAPALAQTSPEDQYGPVEITCDNYLELEIPPPELVEECEAEVITCASLDQYEIPPKDLVEECNQQPPPIGPIGPPSDDAKGSIPEAKNAVDQSLKDFSETLSNIRSGGQNEAEAEEAGASPPLQPEAGASDNPETAPQSSGDLASANTSAGRETGSGQNSAEREDDDRRSDEKDESDAVSESEAVAEESDTVDMPVTSGAPVHLLGAGVLLLAGGLAVGRLFR